ncbi:MerR family transcriptional regulator [Mesorhizobium sp. B2-9-1]|uniref:MerR family transcriptional regulator n=1 Tax=unclassified Mesorhizobium TaxID=325217 RepID=UPI001126A86E|nr:MULTISPECIES: MerR family transcriptional regulator [unclassified Mesorhizobium]TPI45260.1 MerR family transcriptional regulator [Mesorhizobium sp. B2-9-1]TPJ22602.1 MerR family transcriptional regulator [Mesorhizobium sp. B2-7-2]TPN96583.1 MerR family transcriptional regulator [Mesorhizobium sp. B1-1-5]
MRISEAASTSGLSIDTIRYYEKAGLLPPVERGRDGKRRFSAVDVDWLVLLSSLRDTGMRMETMRYFACLYQRGNETIPERRRILLGHSEQLDKQRVVLDRCAEILAHKLKRYDEIAAS